ncbi:hypothetical protein C8R43DRAFT_371137 [Mycena crocata]|nr:hypothetical protein C8R43DRAFT_371137 [Mycena crocata]
MPQLLFNTWGDLSSTTMYPPSADSPLDEGENPLQPLKLDTASTAHSHSRVPSVDLERSGEVPPPISAQNKSQPAYFEPLGDEDVFDVFDLELAAYTPGAKEGGIDARYRSSDTSSGRPTYKLQKKTKAHFLGKKNMNVEVTCSLGWDSSNATPTPHGSKGYVGVFSARDQPSHSVMLTATNSVLSKSSMGANLAVSNVCGMYDPSRGLRREITAHHYFALRLNDMGAPERPALAHGTTKNRRAPPMPVPSPSPAKPYAGGGFFVLDSAPNGRTDLVTTLYCTGYEQRPKVHAGDIVVAELRVRPAGPGAPPPWARFFKERHAALHIARRGLEACMTGPHVNMLIAGAEAAGRRAVLARGQALEVVLAALGTALLAIQHDGLEAKRWAWLVQGGSFVPKPTLALAPSAEDNPGLASPDGEGENTDGHSDDSQCPASAFERGPNSAGLFAGKGYSPSISERRSFADGGSFVDRGSIVGSVDAIELDEWIATATDEAAVPVHPAHPLPTHAPEPPRGGAWARKNSVMSERNEAPLSKGPQHHLKAGSWPQKLDTRQNVIVFDRKEPPAANRIDPVGPARIDSLGVNRMEPLVATVPEPKSPTFSRSGSWADAQLQKTSQTHAQAQGQKGARPDAQTPPSSWADSQQQSKAGWGEAQGWAEPQHTQMFQKGIRADAQTQNAVQPHAEEQYIFA